MQTSTNQQVLPSTIRSVQSVLGKEVSVEKIRELLVQAGGNPEVAIERYFSDMSSASIADIKSTNDSRTESDQTQDKTTNSTNQQVAQFTYQQELKTLETLLEGNVNHVALKSFLVQTSGNVEETIALYFESLSSTQQRNTTASTPPDPTSEMQEGIPVAVPVQDQPTSSQQVLLTITHSNMQWKIGRIFGRAVVEHVVENGPAHSAGVRKSDVLTMYAGAAVDESNCQTVVDLLNHHDTPVPADAAFRRSSTNTSSVESPQVPPVYEGKDILANALKEMRKDLQHPKADPVTLLHFYFQSGGVEAIAVDCFRAMHGVEPNLDQTMGYEQYGRLMDTLDDESQNELYVYVYTVEFPSGPLGMTVENLFERTVIAAVNKNGSAEQVGVQLGSWLIGINGASITHLTHKQVLREIQSATRPIELRFILLSDAALTVLRRQLRASVRQANTNTVLQEPQDTFKVVLEALSWALLVLPASVSYELFELFELEGSDHAEVFQTSTTEGARDEQQDVEFQQQAASVSQYLAECNKDPKLIEVAMLKVIRFFGRLGEVSSEEDKDATSAQVFFQADDRVFVRVVFHIFELITAVQNHVTWEATIAGMIRIIERCSNPLLKTEAVCLVTRLSLSYISITRTVCLRLFPSLYKISAGDLLVQLRGLIERLVYDPNAGVRRGAASILGTIARGMPVELYAWVFALLEKVSSDKHVVVRLHSIQSVAQITEMISASELDLSTCTLETIEGCNLSQYPHLLRCRVIPILSNLVADVNSEVRMKVAEFLPQILSSLGSELADVIVDQLVVLIRDKSSEVRCAAISSSPRVGEALLSLAASMATLTTEDDDEKLSSSADERPSNQKRSNSIDAVDVDDLTVEIQKVDLSGSTGMIEELDDDVPSAKVDDATRATNKVLHCILPAIMGLENEPSLDVRIARAGTVVHFIPLVDAQYVLDFVPAVMQVLEDQNSSVRSTLTTQLARNSKLFPEDALEIVVVPAITQLLTNRLWRTRVLVIDAIMSLAEGSMGERIVQCITTLYKQLLSDPVCEVRDSACKALPLLRDILGTEWIQEEVVPILQQGLETSYQDKMTALTGMKIVIPLVSSEVAGDILRNILIHVGSRTPNVRVRSIEVLSAVQTNVVDDNIRCMAIAILEQVAIEDPDTEVRCCASKALMSYNQS